MDCGGCIRSGYRLVFLTDGRFCVIPCAPGPQPPPVPTPPDISVTSDTSDPTGMTVLLTVLDADGPVTVDWGDGSPTETVEPGSSLTHTYADTGTYTITASLIGDPSLVTHKTVEVPITRPMTWADVKGTWPTWSDIDVPTWADLIDYTPTP